MAQDLNSLARRFTAGADEFLSSPLYREICLTIGADEELLALAANCRAGQQPTNLVLATVHYLLLGGVRHELEGFYASIVEQPRDPLEVGPVFRMFCRVNRTAIIDLLRIRLVQTNVVRRSAALRLGLSVVARREPDPVAFMEVGCSAGVHLCFDRYRYEIGGCVWGDPNSELTIASEWRGGSPPPDLDYLPPIASRLGIDLNPIDSRMPAERRWLQALIWPENRAQAKLLDKALSIVAADPPQVSAGNVLEVGPELAAQLPQGQPLVVFHAATRYHIPREQRRQFDETIASLAGGRRLYWLSLEGPLFPEPRIPPAVPVHVLGLRQIDGAEESKEHLALVAGHVEWMQPLDL